ncbi:MAG: hypothetical protein ACYDIA_13715 [Candidatus Humimicrobiaceae bacterium]
MNRFVKFLALILSVLCFLFLLSCVTVSKVEPTVKTTKENTTAQRMSNTSLERLQTKNKYYHGGIE